MNATSLTYDDWREDRADRLYEAWCARQFREANPVTEPGFYLARGTVYRVQRSRSTGHLYALALEIEDGRGRFEYVTGAIYALSCHDRMTTEQAAELGHHYGLCVICGATLTDPASVTRGIGPVCVKRLAVAA